jgi:hypothetical protein
MNYWKVYCKEDAHPGLWRRCFRAQCATVGWPPGAGYHLEGRSKRWGATKRVQNALGKISVGDEIVIQLPHNRIARIGSVVAVKVTDDDWKSLVPRSSEEPDGEQGRRIEVRWNLEIGPDDPEMVVELPPDARLGGGARGTINAISRARFRKIRAAMQEEANWVGLTSRIGHETVLSDYLAAVPHHLEDGLEPYPYAKVREKTFSDRSRPDVLLQDSREKPVVVECKKGSLVSKDVRQLVGYMRLARKEIGHGVRGILLHGGARKLRSEIKRELAGARRRGFLIEVQQYELSVRFAPSR